MRWTSPAGTKGGAALAAFFAAVALWGVPVRSVFAAMPAFAASPTLALQIALDRRGFSCNTIDGAWGGKSETALATYCAVQGVAVPPAAGTRTGAAAALAALFPDEPPLFKTEIVAPADVAACVQIPDDPAAKAALPAMGYETLQEMFAERSHLSQVALRRLNPDLAWPNPPVGAQVTLPDFGDENAKPKRVAAVLRVSLSRLEITAFDAEGALIALYPCSIAAAKAKRPPAGELQVRTIVPQPNYTYTPDRAPPGKRISRFVFPPGPNNPVGVAWLGLSLPGYGMHGTPFPERIGRAESHGCFRLANWNARRLLKSCNVGTGVVVEE